MRVAVIGGGPSGIVTLKTLKTAHHYLPIKPIEATLFDSARKIGGIFFHHSYEDGEMVSSTHLTTFSDFRPPPGSPDFFTSEQYLDYLDGYATHFNLWSDIKLSSSVKSVRRRDGGGHTVVYQTEGEEEIEWDCDAIAVCSGLHDKPNIPSVAGIEYIPEKWHSEHFKTRSQMENKKTIMILGSGETAADIGHLAMTTSGVDKVVLCHRDGWMGAPKVIPNTVLFPTIRSWRQEDFQKNESFTGSPVPIDVSQSTLFDTMYVHPMVRDTMIVWNHYKFLSLDASWLVTGVNRGYDQYVGSLPDEKRHTSKMLFNKAWSRLQPYLIPPYRPSAPGIVERIRRFFIGNYWPDAGRYIDLAPFPATFTPTGRAVFHDNGRPEYPRIAAQTITPDLVIFATGYEQTFPFFAGCNEVLQTDDSSITMMPYPHAADANVRKIFSSSDPTTGFIGFIRPGFGAIPPLSELQAMLWTMVITGQLDPATLSPNDEPHYWMLPPPGHRIKYGVEHDSYAWQLAVDMGAAPGFKEILGLGWRWRGDEGKRMGAWYKLPIVWAGSSHFGAKFRMVGPWKWDGAVGVMVGEQLWETVTRRRGLFNNFTLFIMPCILLGTASLLAWIWCTIWGLLAWLNLAPKVRYTNHLRKISDENMKVEKEMKKKMEMGVNGIQAVDANGTTPLLAAGNGHGDGNGYGAV